VTKQEATRPILHFTAKEGWINDPLGLTWHSGKYHLFFQHLPGASAWQPNCHWGHATSTDLVSWDEQEIALYPDDMDGGVWSGSLVKLADRAVIFYTSVSLPHFAIGRVRTAVSSDDELVDWEKQPGYTFEVPDNLRLSSFRDPFVFKDTEAGKWRLLMGASLIGEQDGSRSEGFGDTGAVVTFTSSDLVTWDYDSVALSQSVDEKDPLWMGSLWECPQTIEVDGQQFLIVSVWHADQLNYVAYRQGAWADGVFVPAGEWKQLTFGDGYYASMTFTDATGKPCVMHWIRGVKTESAVGAISVPHVLHFEDDRLLVRPHDSVRNAVPLLDVDSDIAPDSQPRILRITSTDVFLTGIGWRVRRTAELVEVFTDVGRYEVPADDNVVEVVVDFGCIEIFTTLGVLAVPIQ